ncbi:unnamed protein product [Brugia pahangi]|uniref:Uncharacterized protein n=1 Tax=Brugia pahangi TaxID=6280 RepID=A0A0N4T9M4_BRUPA|nr:unnamed protein product [Brugia pahangi]
MIPYFYQPYNQLYLVHMAFTTRITIARKP